MSVTVGTSSAQSPASSNYGGLKAEVAAYVQGQDQPGVLADAGVAINSAIDEVNKRAWKWLTRTQDITTSTERTYTVNANFKKPWTLVLVDANSKEAGRIEYQIPKIFANSEWNESNSVPEFYTVRNPSSDRLLTLNYAPNAEWVAKYPTLRLNYFARMDHFASDGDTIGDLSAPPEVATFIKWHARFELAATRGGSKQIDIAEKKWLRSWRDLVADHNDEQSDWSPYR